MLKKFFISTKYIILFKLKEYPCNILVFSSKIFGIFSTGTYMKIGSNAILKTRHFWRETW